MTPEANCRLVLGSSSPRRRELLALLGVPFEIVVPHVDEQVLPGEGPVDHVRRLAGEKSRDVAARKAGTVVLGADTIVVLDGRIIGKPADGEEACRLLGVLSGREHTVYTAVAVVDGAGDLQSDVVSSAVTIATLTAREIEEYVATGEPLDKAGAYAVQGAGGRLVTGVAGSLTNVIGLPLRETCSMLARARCGVRLPEAGSIPGGRL